MKVTIGESQTIGNNLINPLPRLLAKPSPCFGFDVDGEFDVAGVGATGFSGGGHRLSDGLQPKRICQVFIF